LEIADTLVYYPSYKAQVHPHFKICKDFKFCLETNLNCVVDFQGSSATSQQDLTVSSDSWQSGGEQTDFVLEDH